MMTEPVESGTPNTSEVAVDMDGYRPPKRWPLYVVFALGIIIPTMFFYQTWFGVRLDDETLRAYLTDPAIGRHVQHGLEEMSRRITEDVAAAAEFYPEVVKAAGHKEASVRTMCAWLMGFDNRADVFHDALLTLLTDSEVLVRYNAALSLSKFNDGKARLVLREMLNNFMVVSPKAGTVSAVLDPSAAVLLRGRVAVLETADEGSVKVLAPLRGYVAKAYVVAGDRIAQGDVLCSLRPNWEQVWEALRAFYLVGEKADLELLESYTRSQPGIPKNLKKQAALTVAAIRKRFEEATLLVYSKIGNFQLTERSGQPFQRADLLGKMWVADFMFTSCSGICPVMTGHMKDLQDATKEAGTLRLLSITFDPERDTPEVLSAFATSYGADEERWYFLTGDKEVIYKLSLDSFKLPIAEASAGEINGAAENFIHSQRLVLVDRDCQVRGIYQGLEDGVVEAILKDIEILKREETVD